MVDKSQIRSVLVRPWAPHWASVRNLYLDAFPPEERINLTFLAASATLRNSCHFNAYFQGEEFLGFTYTITHSDVTVLLFLAVDPQARGGGVGSMLVKRVIADAGDRSVVLQVEPLDSAAENFHEREKRWMFYERLGFRQAHFDTVEAGVRYSTLYWGAPIAPSRLQGVFRSFFRGTRALDVIAIGENHC